MRSSISASSAPAVYAWMHAVMSLSLLCELSFGSTTSGYGRRTWTVNSVMPFSTTSGRGTLCSAMITTVAGPIVTRGSWYGVLFTPRVTISRTCTPSRMSLARNVSEIASASSSRVRPMSIAIAFAPSNNRSRCCARKAGRPSWTRRPSQTPSPRTNPLSKTDTTACARGTSAPFTWTSTSALRGSSS